MTIGGRRADSSQEDELISRLYQQVTEQQAARFAAGYDMAAGLDRYRAWLSEHTASEPAGPQGIPAAAPTELEAALALSLAGAAAAALVLPGEPADVSMALRRVADALNLPATPAELRGEAAMLAELEPVGVPMALREVADVITALCAPPTPAELRGEATIMAEFSALAEFRALGLSQAGRRSRWSRRGRTTKGSPGTGSGPPAARDGGDAEEAVTALHQAHYKSLVLLTVLLGVEVATAHEIVQDSFRSAAADVPAGGPDRGDTDGALSYLLGFLVDRSRSALRRQVTADPGAPKTASAVTSAGQGALALLEGDPVVRALRSLPARMREAIVLRYYADLREDQVALAMGVSPDAVRLHIARAALARKGTGERASQPASAPEQKYRSSL